MFIAVSIATAHAYPVTSQDVVGKACPSYVDVYWCWTEVFNWSVVIIAFGPVFFFPCLSYDDAEGYYKTWTLDSGLDYGLKSIESNTDRGGQPKTKKHKLGWEGEIPLPSDLGGFFFLT